MPHADVNGERLYYEISGNPSAPKLVCIRGLSRSLRYWGRTRDQLEQNFHVLTYDHRGIGRSGISGKKFWMNDLSDDLAALMGETGFDKAHVFGISLGGMVAQHLALDHSHRVDKLILGCTWMGSRKATFPSLSSLAVLAFGSRLPPKVGTKLQAPRLLSKSYLKDNPNAVEHWVPLLEQEPPDRKVVFRQALSGAFHNTAARIPDIEHDTMVVTGDADRLIHKRNSELLAERLPNSRLVMLPGVGHELPSEAGPRLVELLEEFLLAKS